jgi:hypothetical protein
MGSLRCMDCAKKACCSTTDYYNFCTCHIILFTII